MNTNPYVGNILQTSTKYSGADYVYSYFIKSDDSDGIENGYDMV